MKKILSFIFSVMLVLPVFAFVGCGGSDDGYKSISGLDTSKEVTLKIAVDKYDLGLNKVVNEFTKRYSNVKVKIENFNESNANAKIKDGTIDIAFKDGIKYSEDNDNYYYDFAKDTEIDFSSVNPEVFYNHRYKKTGTEEECQYSLPLGGDLRGLFVNKTLLNYWGLEVPTNYTEFLECCETIRNDKSGIAIQGNPGYAAVNFGIADAVSSIVKDAAKYEKLKNNAENTDIEELFRDTYAKIYEVSTKRYYDYKFVEENSSGQFFKKATRQASVYGFLGLTTDVNGNTIHPGSAYGTGNYGAVAFFPYISSLSQYIDTTIEENNLSTEYTFIATPLNAENEKPAFYVTPSLGVYANKNSSNLIWIREFVNFIFHPENNILYAKNSGVIPNVKDSADFSINTFLKDNYNTSSSDCIFCGKINFDSYNAYNPIADSMIDLFKCSAQKYMVNLKYNSDTITYCNDSDDKGDYLKLADASKITYHYLEELSTIFNADDGLGGFYTKASSTSKVYTSNLKKEDGQVVTYHDAKGDYFISGTNTKIYLSSLLVLSADETGSYYTNAADPSTKTYVSSLNKEGGLVVVNTDATLGDYFTTGTDTRIYLSSLIALADDGDSLGTYYTKAERIYVNSLNKNAGGVITYLDSENKEYYVKDTNTKIYKDSGAIGLADPANTSLAFLSLNYYMAITEDSFREYR